MKNSQFRYFLPVCGCETTVRITLLLTNTDLRLHHIIGRVKTRERIRRNVNFGICDSTVHYSSVRYRLTCYPFCYMKKNREEETRYSLHTFYSTFIKSVVAVSCRSAISALSLLVYSRPSRRTFVLRFLTLLLVPRSFTHNAETAQ